MSPVISSEGIDDLETLIADHHLVYIECYGTTNYIPKLHMLIHLAEQAKQFGPLRHHWTMRFEGKNNLPKTKKFYNYRNVPLSVAELYQINASCALWDNFGNPKPQHCKEVNVGVRGVPLVVSSTLVNAGAPSALRGHVVLAVTSATINNVNLSVSDILMINSASGNDPVFVRISEILVRDDDACLSCHILYNKGFEKYLNGFILQDTSHLIIVKPDALMFPWPLYQYKYKGVVLAIPQCLHLCP